MSTFHTELLYSTAACTLCTVGAVFDIRDRRIPNLLTLPGVLAGLLLHLFTAGWHGMGSSAAAGLIAFVLFLIFWLAGGMGAGDVKLMAAAACLTGLTHVVWLLIFTALAGGVMGIAMALWRGQLRETFLNVGAIAVHHRYEGLTPHPELHVGNARTLRLPYAVAIAAGAAVVLAMTVVQR